VKEKKKKSYLCNDEVTLRRQRDVFQGTHVAERPPASVAAAAAAVAVAAAVVAAVRTSAGYFASASAFESLAARVCDGDADADTTPASNTLTNSPLARKEAHKEESALPSPANQTRVFSFHNYSLLFHRDVLFRVYCQRMSNFANSNLDKRASESKVAELTANEGSGGLGLGCTKSTGCRVCCVCGGLPLLRRLRFSGAGVSSLCGVKAGVSGGVCVGLCEPGSGLPSSESFRLLVRFLTVTSDSGIPDEVDTTVIFRGKDFNGKNTRQFIRVRISSG